MWKGGPGGGVLRTFVALMVPNRHQAPRVSSHLPSPKRTKNATTKTPPPPPKNPPNPPPPKGRRPGRPGPPLRRLPRQRLPKGAAGVGAVQRGAAAGGAGAQRRQAVWRRAGGEVRGVLGCWVWGEGGGLWLVGCWDWGVDQVCSWWWSSSLPFHLASASPLPHTLYSLVSVFITNALVGLRAQLDPGFVPLNPPQVSVNFPPCSADCELGSLIATAPVATAAACLIIQH